MVSQVNGKTIQVGELSSPILLPYQQRWISDRSPVKVAEKSRQIGFSWCEAADCALTAAAAGGMDCWIVSVNEDSAREFIGDVAFWAKVYQLTAEKMQQLAMRDESKDILSFRITFASGFRVTALSSRPSNLRGKRGKVVIDEFAFHDNPGELLKAALALLMWGGQLSIFSTHNGVESEFNQLIGDIRAGKKPYSIHRVTFDDALADGLYKRIALKLGLPVTPKAEQQWRDDLLARYGSDADEELFCIPSRSGGVYFSRVLVESRMSDRYPVLRLALPASFTQQSEEYRQAFIETWCRDNLHPLLSSLGSSCRSFFGMDFGRSGDLSAIAPLLEGQNLKRWCPFLLEVRNCPFEAQKHLLFYLVDGLEQHTRFSGGAMDKTGNGAFLAEVASQKYGTSQVQQVQMTQQWHMEAWPRYKAALEDGDITLPKDLDILDDHRQVKVVNGIAKVPEGARYKGSDGGQRHGDTAIAFCLAWNATVNQPTGDWSDAVVVGPRRSTADLWGDYGYSRDYYDVF
jgi:phage FluMu gp28-like protein